MTTEEEQLPVQELDTDRETVRVRLRLPQGYKLIPDGAHTVVLTSADDEVLLVPPFDLPDLGLDYQVPVVVKGEGETVLHLQAMVFFCPESDESICLFNACDVEQPVVVRAGSDGDVEIVHDIVPP